MVYLIVGAILIVLVIGLAFRRWSQKKRKEFMAKLIFIKEITHDTKIFTFDLPKGQNQIGLKVGEHLQIQAVIDGKTVARKYTPISRADIKRNSFELLIKVYRKTETIPGGVMSEYLDSLKIGDSIKVTLPYGRFNYLGNSQIQVRQLNGQTHSRKIEHFYLIGGGTGITPLFQIIQHVTEVQPEQSRPQLTLLFANRTEDDILVKAQLEDFARQNNQFKCHFSVDTSIREGWTGFIGFVDEEKIRKTMPKEMENAFFAVCGPPRFCSLVEKMLLTQFKVPANQFYRF